MNPYAPPAAAVADASVVQTRSDSALGLHTLQTISPSERRLVIWGFLWRALIAAIISMFLGAIAGGILGFITTLVGKPAGIPMTSILSIARLLGGVIGFGMGILVTVLYVGALFRASFAGYRLRLVKMD